MDEHTVKFSGLKDGRHHFSYTLSKGFFTELADDDMPHGEVQAEVDLDKSSTMLITSIHTDGHLEMLCDRCNTTMNYPVHGELRQIFNLGGRAQIEQEEITSLDPKAFEINLSQYLYECIRLALPLRRVHPPDACDQDVLNALEGNDDDAPEATDPRWDSLRSMTNKPA